MILAFYFYFAPKINNLNFAYYISKRIRSKKLTSFSGAIHSVAVFSIALSIIAMIISFLILGGFKTKIHEKIYSFGGHLQVTKFSFSSSFDEEPITTKNRLNEVWRELDFIDHVQPFANKPGLIKANEEVMGVVLKGVNEQFDYERFSENMIAGRMIRFSDTTDAKEVIISQKVSELLQIHLNEDILIYFVEEPVRVRKVKIVGIYETGMEDFDEKVVLGDLRMVQKLNLWPETFVGGFEIFLKDLHKVDVAFDYLDQQVLEPNLYLEKTADVFLEIFDWLTLLDKNVIILMFFILLVACINMTSILLILIMERTQMVGLLKALGSANAQIRNIFVYNGINLTLRGLLYGNLIGLGLAAAQHYFKIVRLDPVNYYMSYVPILWDWGIILSLNALVFIIISLILMIPSVVIANIDPIKTLRFD